MEQTEKRPLTGRGILLLCVWAVLIALDFAGLIWNIVQLQTGTMEWSKFSYSLLHFFVSIGTISAIYIAEFLFRFRAGAPLVICCALFAFFGNTVSNVYNMYDYFPDWDMVLHSLSGVLFAALGLGLASVVLRNQPEGKRKIIAVILFTLFFSLTVGYLWEIFEFTVDSIDPSMTTQGWADGILERYPDGTYLVNSRRGTAILDTMGDMILHLIGSLVILVPLLIAFWKKPSRMNAFAFTPVPRRKGADKTPNTPETPAAEQTDEPNSPENQDT